jgi:hypothetical protein
LSLILDGTLGLSDVDGSAATPAIRGTDSNTGVFFATDIVGLATGGTERMRITSGGDVGIGTSSPSAKFEVYNSAVNGSFVPNTLSTWRVAQVRNDQTSTSNSAAGIAFVGRSDTQPAGIVAINGNTTGGVVGLGFLTVDGNVTYERMRIDSSGNVGIGVTPSAWRTINRALQIGTNTCIANVDASTNSAVDFGTNFYYDSSGDIRYLINSFSGRYRQQGGNHTFFSGGSGTAGNVITETQLLSVGIGTSLSLQGATPQSGTGITFPATQSASSNANTLDDYEEGTFNPNVIGTSTAGTVTYGDRSGKYTKIGNKVFYTVYVTWTSGTGTGNLQITGLPFTSANNGEYPTAAIYTNNLNYTSGNTVVCYIGPNGTAISILQSVPNSGAISIPYDANVDGFIISGFYTTA